MHTITNNTHRDSNNMKVICANRANERTPHYFLRPGRADNSKHITAALAAQKLRIMQVELGNAWIMPHSPKLMN